MNIINKAGVAGVCLGTSLFLSVTSFAAQQADKPGFYGSIGVSYTDDDNVFRQPGSSELSDSIITISPELTLIKEFGKHQLTAQYLGDYASYDKYSEEEYDDHAVNVDLFLDLTRKFNIDLQANYIEGHESRGAPGIVPGLTANPTLWEENRLFAGFSYGRRTAKAQFEIDLVTKNLDFTNNSQDARDRDTNTIAGRVFFNVGEKTSLFIEAKQNDIDYDDPASTLDSTENFYHVGVRWDATAKTSGEIKVGTFDKDFDSAASLDDDGTSYEGSITWEPQTYSRLIVGLSQLPYEASTGDSFYTSSLVSLDWEHDFNSKLALNLNVSSGTDDYSGAREDDLFNAGVGINYQFRRWLDFGLKYNYSDRDSNVSTADFEDNLFMLTATFMKPTK